MIKIATARYTLNKNENIDTVQRLNYTTKKIENK